MIKKFKIIIIIIDIFRIIPVIQLLAAANDCNGSKDVNKYDGNGPVNSLFDMSIKDSDCSLELIYKEIGPVNLLFCT